MDKNWFVKIVPIPVKLVELGVICCAVSVTSNCNCSPSPSSTSRSAIGRSNKKSA